MDKSLSISLFTIFSMENRKLTLAEILSQEYKELGILTKEEKALLKTKRVKELRGRYGYKNKFRN